MIDDIINHKDLSFVTRAIRFLNPIRAINSKKIIGENNAIKPFNILFKLFSKVYYFFYNSIINFLIKEKATDKLKKCDVLIISHFLKKDFLEKKEDFYFGSISNHIEKEKKTCFKLLINHTNFNSNYLNKKIHFSDRYIIPNQLDFFSELKIFLLKILEIINFLSKVNKIKMPLKFSYIRSMFEAETTNALRMYFFLKKNLHLLNPKNLIFTHEGYPWEKMCVKSSKEFNNKIRCIGYQHIMINKYNFGLLRKIDGDYKPDFIWANGKLSQKVLSKSKNKKNKILISGLFKKNVSKKISYNIKDKNILVIPEGIYDECKKLFEFSYLVAKQNKNFKFIWRLHPVINLHKLKRILNFDLEKIPMNIIISKKRLITDSQNSSYVLYRGSAAVVDSIRYGCKPIYYIYQNQKYFDPIINFKFEKEMVKNIYEMNSLLKKEMTNIKRKNIIRKADKFYKLAFGEIEYKSVMLSLR